MMDFIFLPHAREQMQQREIPLQVLLEILNHPEAIIPSKYNRIAYQSVVEINGKPYLIRAFVEPDGIVISFYRSSKISKY